MNADLQRLLDAPLANALSINLPLGRRTASRGPKAVYEGSMGDTPIPLSEVKARRDSSKSNKLVAVLDYYATTTVPFERIAEHTKLSVDQVRESMANRGRGE